MLCRYYENVAIPSKDILTTVNIEPFLRTFSEHHTASLSHSNDLDAVVGWDLSPDSRGLQKWALQRNLPYIRLQSGFYQPHGWVLGDTSPISLIADDSAKNCNAEQANNMLTELDKSSDISEQSSALQVLDFLKDRRLSQSQQREANLPAWLRQGQNDYVLIAGCMNARNEPEELRLKQSCFAAMLEDAINNYSADQIIIKTSPEVLNGKITSCFDPSNLPKGIQFLTETVNSWELFEQVRAVHCDNNNLGLEALMADCEVHCYEPSFFSGRGLTRDHFNLPAQQQACSLAKLIDMAILKYPIYIDPFNGKICKAEKGLEILADLRDRSDGLFEPKIMMDISGWKTQSLTAFTGPVPKQNFTKDRAVATRKCEAEKLPLYGWSSSMEDAFVQQLIEAGIRLIRIEDGFLRSVGLGVNLVPACSLVFDPIGIYYDGRSPSRLENLLNDRKFNADSLARARDLRRKIVSSRLTKYNLSSRDNSALLQLPANRPILLVAGQVETDASIICSTPIIKTNLALLKTVRDARPEAYIIYKPHPDVATGLRKGKIARKITENLADHVENNLSSEQLLDQVDEVHTLTSLLGFEALLRDIKVYTYGLPFYAGWGLTTDLCTFDRRKDGLLLDALVAGTLIEYPSYVDPVSGLLCEPETIVQRLAANINIKGSNSLKERLRRVYNRSFIARVIRQTLWRIGS